MVVQMADGKSHTVKGKCCDVIVWLHSVIIQSGAVTVQNGIGGVLFVYLRELTGNLFRLYKTWCATRYTVMSCNDKTMARAFVIWTMILKPNVACG